MSSLRKSLQRFAEDLQLFSGQLAQEAQELKRNAEHRPITGATHFRHCLEDINDRLSAVGEELQALEAVSLDAISLEELVGHCVALYQHNHEAIAQLEQRLQQYGYRDVYAPLPPENPLDMLMLRAPAAVHTAPGMAGAQVASTGPSYAPQAPHHLREPLEHITNSFTAVCLHDNVPGSAARPSTAVKAMAPMTAIKARARSETPSSLSSSPLEAMSPSMRELLGKYASSTSGPPTQYSGTPFSHSATPPVMGQLTPAFAASRLASGQARAAAADPSPAGSEGQECTPEAKGGATDWAADPTMYNVLTATAKKLATKPDFLEDIRQRFPHIAASTERLLASVEKQQPSAAAAGSDAAAHAATLHMHGAAGPVPALAAEAATAVSQHLQQQHGEGIGPSRLGLGSGLLAGGRKFSEEETTVQLYSQVISTRPYPMPATHAEEPVPEEPEPQLGASLTPPRPAAASPCGAAAPSTEALLSKAFSTTTSAASSLPPSDAAGLRSHPIAELTATGAATTSGLGSAAAATSFARATAAQLAACQGPAEAAPPDASASSVPRPDRSRPDLQEAIEAALRRGAAPQPTATPAVLRQPAAAAAGSTAAVASMHSGPSTAASSVPSYGAVPTASQLRAVPMQPGQAAAAPDAPSAQPVVVPPLHLLTEQEYDTLPTFIKGQLSLDHVNDSLATVHASVSSRAAAGGVAGFTLEDLEELGLGGKAKVFINSIVKLSRAHLKVVYGQGTVYLLL